MAVDLPSVARRELAHWARGAAASSRASGGWLRLLEPETLHVTLCFLGEQPAGAIDAIAQAMRVHGRTRSVSSRWGRRCGCPSAVRGRSRSSCTTTPTARSSVCATRSPDRSPRPATSRPSARRFRPHVTVARMRSGDAPRERGLPPTPQRLFEPVALVLYRSWLGPTEASYEALVRCAPPP